MRGALTPVVVHSKMKRQQNEIERERERESKREREKSNDFLSPPDISIEEQCASDTAVCVFIRWSSTETHCGVHTDTHGERDGRARE